MKTTIPKHRARAAFTLAEMMIASALATMLVGGVIVGHLIGLRMFQYTRTKLGGNDDTRRAISKLVEEVRSAKLVKVGSGDANGFVECALDSPQQGNAIQVYETNDTNTFIRFFLDSDTTLRRMPNAASSASILANYITNKIVFTAEDFNGTVLTNNVNNRVIGLTLQFYQIEYPIVKVGANQMYDYYQVRTKITRRTLE
jgi:hypothetical protein